MRRTGLKSSDDSKLLDMTFSETALVTNRRQKIARVRKEAFMLFGFVVQMEEGLSKISGECEGLSDVAEVLESVGLYIAISQTLAALKTLERPVQEAVAITVREKTASSFRLGEINTYETNPESLIEIS